MLQIKKKAHLTALKYNLQFLFRNKTAAKLYKAQKQVSHSITLRSPKHFNIGKHKILNLNYKTPQLIVSLGYKFFITSLFNNDVAIFNRASRRIRLTPNLFVKSMKLMVKTKFKIMWLET